jgi:hypothetical protein
MAFMARFSQLSKPETLNQRNTKTTIKMKKLLLLPLFILGAMSVSKAQAPVTSGMENKNGPVMTFEEMEFNFGTIKQGDIVTHEFKFKNTGKEPLVISEAHGSCGCTVPEYPKEPIKPNGSGVIKVTFNSAGKMGQQDKTVTLTYGDAQQIVIHLKGTVETPAVQAPTPNTPAPTPAPAGSGGKATPAPTAAAPAGTKPAPAPAPAPTGAKPTPAPAAQSTDKPKH